MSVCWRECVRACVRVCVCVCRERVSVPVGCFAYLIYILKGHCADCAHVYHTHANW